MSKKIYFCVAYVVLESLFLSSAVADPVNWNITVAATQDVNDYTVSVSSQKSFSLGSLSSNISLHDVFGRPLDYATVSLGLSVPLMENSTSILKFSSGLDLDSYLQLESMSQNSHVAVSFSKKLNPSTQAQFNFSHSVKDNLHEQIHRTTSINTGMYTTIGNVILGSSLGIGANSSSRGNDDFLSYSLNISVPINEKFSIMGNIGANSSHQRRIFDDLAYDIWADSHSISLNASYILSHDTSLSANAVWSETSTEYFSNYFSGSDLSWRISISKSF
ncbi:hypothetical protein MWN63_15315 [Paradonghicola geojensis]|nr:hypothetical protein [Marivivens geojensis]